MSTVTPFPAVPRPEALLALGQHVQRRAVNLELLASLKSMLAMQDSGVHAVGIIRRARAAVAAAEAVRS